MGENLRYQSRRLLEIDEVEEILARADDRLKGFQGFEPGDRVLVTAHPRRLHDLESSKDIVSHELYVEGELAVQENPFPVFRRIVASGRELGEKGNIALSLGFEEKGGGQTKKRHATLRGSVVKGSCRWSFMSLEALTLSSEACQAYIERIVEAAGLPVRVVSEEDGFRLEAADEVGLSIMESQKPRSQNPTAFSCRLPGVASEDLVGRMSRCVEEIGSSRRFWQRWKIFPGIRSELGKPEFSNLIFKTLTAAPDDFPAKTYLVGGEFVLRSLSGLKALRTLCHGDDSVLTALGFYLQRGTTAVNLQIKTGEEGHRLLAESRGPVDLIALEEMIGVELFELETR